LKHAAAPGYPRITMTLPRSVVIGECFAPDGLQNEDAFVATDLEVRFVEAR